MNRDDIIRMAVEAGARDCANPDKWDIWEIRDTDLERFAALVAAHEREACRLIVLDNSDADGICCTDDVLEAFRQPNQEPAKDKLDFWALFDENQRLRAELKFNTTLRPWVGLTKEEAKEISLANRPYVIDMIAALEARLKEKNT